MNDRQFDSLLEQLKGNVPPAPQDCLSDDDFCRRFWQRTKRRQKRLLAICASSLVLLAGIILCVSLKQPQAWLLRVDTAQEDSQELACALDMFPEAGVAVVNNELESCLQQSADGNRHRIRLCLISPEGRRQLTMDLVIADNDYIAFENGTLNGSILFSRCSDKETIIDFNLSLQTNTHSELSLNDIVVVGSRTECPLENKYKLVVETHYKS